jgi:hypothetical protein
MAPAFRAAGIAEDSPRPSAMRQASRPRTVWVNPVAIPARDDNMNEIPIPMFSPTRSMNGPTAGFDRAQTTENVETSSPYWAFER